MRLLVGDLETDPFEPGKMVKPFLSGFYDGSKMVSYWHTNCVAQMCEGLKREEPGILYFHNGGRFDFFYFLPHLSVHELRIINGRIVQATLGKHTLRDSYAIMPFPLAAYDKDVIDYKLMKPGIREKHKPEIMKYFRRDLTSLYELVTTFHEEFGDKLTIGGTSMGELKKLHPFACGGEYYDEQWRKRFYFGGRNQVFKPGVTEGDIRVYDVNSMYPTVMKDVLHPIGVGVEVNREVTKDTCFLVVQGKNYGAFPVRVEKTNGLDFEVPHGEFCTSIHEFNTAIETGTFVPTRIVKTYNWRLRGTFDTFIDTFYAKRMSAKATGDKIRTIFYKFILNSAYGKFCQNPDNYMDWYLTAYGEEPGGEAEHHCTTACPADCPKRWIPAWICESAYIIWKRPIAHKVWYNVATGASITAAARSILLRGLAGTPEPLYCDTDSIICRGPAKIDMDENRLGAWKLEATGNKLALAGKKLYALFDANGECVKKAHKGVRLSGPEILRITQGETIAVSNMVPSFKWDGTHDFIVRKVGATAKGLHRV